jgi:hypothetical protein
MKTKLLFLLALLTSTVRISHAQYTFRQYFDGADTSAINSLFIVPDSSVGNIWQIGNPRKTIFNAAATAPNAMMTDTVSLYPQSDTSRFSFRIRGQQFGGVNAVVAIRWKQKLDMEKRHSGGIVEFSKNGGAWQNIFNNTSVYNFYGYMQANKDTLNNGAYAFSGQDTTWRDIWLCFRYIAATDTMDFRFTFMSDTSSNRKEGWMIDNMMAQHTFQHTVSQIGTTHDSKVYPTQTTGLVFVEASHLLQPHYIRSLSVSDRTGKVLQHYNDEQSRFMIDLGMYPTGTYYVKVETNLGTELFPVVLQH